MTTTTTTTAPRQATVKTFAALAGQLAEAGFSPGAAPHITPESRRIDAAVCRNSQCPGCRRRGRKYRPYHLGTRYRVLAHCLHDGCGAGSEV